VFSVFNVWEYPSPKDDYFLVADLTQCYSEKDKKKRKRKKIE